MSKANKSSFGKSADPYENRVGLVYARVSSKRQETEGSGLQSQTGRCAADLKAIGVPHEKTFPDSFSGGGDFTKRPAMRELLAYVDAHPHKKFVVVFDDLKRFARDTEFHIKLRAAFKARDVLLRCLNYNFDESPEGRFAELIMAGQAELERHQNSRQVSQKMRARLEAGYWTFGSKKGYVMIKDTLHGTFAVPRRDEAVLLKTALEGFSTGIFVRKVDACKYLVEGGFWKKQRPEKYIHKFSSLLKDPFYAGFIEYPKWDVERRMGRHEAIISLETYELNQRRVKAEGLNKRIRVDVSEDFPLRGLHVCNDCSKPLTGAWTKGRHKRYPYYFCQNFSCEQKGKAIPKEEMEEAFAELLKKQTLKDETDMLVKNVFDTVWEDEVKEIRKSELMIQKHKQNLEEKLKELTRLVIGAKSDAIKRAYENQLEEVALELESSNSVGIDELDLSVPYRTALSKAGRLLKSPYKIWNSVDVLEKHRLFFFIFEEKLAYSKKEGYRTDNLPSAIRLFEEFVYTNSHDVDTLSTNWNQLESYVFEAYELIKGANLGNSSKELATV